MDPNETVNKCVYLTRGTHKIIKVLQFEMSLPLVYNPFFIFIYTIASEKDNEKS